MPLLHGTSHLISALAAVVVSGVAMTVVRNRVIRRRLLFSLVAALAAVAWHLLAPFGPDGAAAGPSGVRLERLVLVCAAANGIVSLIFNPWFRDGESDRAPSIVQDSVVVAAALVAAAVLFEVSSFNFLTGSAILAAVVGFALQDTLGNAFAGIAIQIERPFRVGHWIAVGEWTGLVTEVTWRATKMRTKAGNVVAVPNSAMASHAITNFSEPAVPTRLQLDVGAAYGVPPNEVRSALQNAVTGADLVLASPAPDVVVADFGASAITYRVRFWIDDFARDELARDAVRTRIYYEFRRRNIEIPWPIQVEYQREEPPRDSPERRAGFAEAIARVPVLAALPVEAHHALAASARELLFAAGEVIVGEGDSGTSMFIVIDGRAEVTVGPERRRVALTETGGYFGEMSMLTGEPRSATVVATADCRVLEVTADAFGRHLRTRPEVIDQLAAAATGRRRELDELRSSVSVASASAAASMSRRIREFFGL